mgnify:FL=1
MACIIGNTAELFFPKLDMKNDLVNFACIFPPLLKELGYEPFVCASEEEARNSMHLVKEGMYPVYLFKTDTSGEKLYEEFYTDGEKYNLDKYKALGVIQKQASYSSMEFDGIIMELESVLARPGIVKADIVAWLNKYIPEFEHIETGLSLDKKM